MIDASTRGIPAPCRAHNTLGDHTDVHNNGYLVFDFVHGVQNCTNTFCKESHSTMYTIVCNIASEFTSTVPLLKLLTRIFYHKEFYVHHTTKVWCSMKYPTSVRVRAPVLQTRSISHRTSHRVNCYSSLPLSPAHTPAPHPS